MWARRCFDRSLQLSQRRALSPCTYRRLWLQVGMRLLGADRDGGTLKRGRGRIRVGDLWCSGRSLKRLLSVVLSEVPLVKWSFFCITFDKGSFESSVEELTRCHNDEAMGVS